MTEPSPRKIQTIDNDVAPEDLEPRRPIEVICDNLRSAYNVGSFFRTCDALRIGRLHLCGITAAPPNAKLAKTALGTTDYVPWSQHASAAEAIAAVRARGVTVVAVEVTDRSRPLWDYAFPRPVALVFGHEVSGVDDDVLALCDEVVAIPQEGLKNSLNVATAMGVVLYEAARQHGPIISA